MSQPRLGTDIAKDGVNTAPLVFVGLSATVCSPEGGRVGAMCCRAPVERSVADISALDVTAFGDCKPTLKASVQMFLAFVGDVHGCVRHAMTAVLALQHHERHPLDLIIQIGDVGAFPSPDRLGPVDRAYVEANTPRAMVSACCPETKVRATHFGGSGRWADPGREREP